MIASRELAPLDQLVKLILPGHADVSTTVEIAFHDP
jgi:hypothetical protein